MGTKLLLTALVVGSTTVAVDATPSAAASPKFNSVGDRGPAAGTVRLEAVRYNGGVDQPTHAFVPVATSVDPAAPTIAVSNSGSSSGSSEGDPATSPTPLAVVDGAPVPPAPAIIDTAVVIPVASEPDFQTTVTEFVTGGGGRVVSSNPGVVLVDIPAQVRPALTTRLAGRGIELREPVTVGRVPNEAIATGSRPAFGSITGENVSVTRANLYHQAGFTGKGVKIGVIDFFDFKRYWNPAEHGTYPVAGSQARCLRVGADCTAELFDGYDANGYGKHGVAVTESIRDMAPGAVTYYATAYTASDTYDIIRWFQSKGVTIISRSLADGYDSPGDGTGRMADAAQFATSLGMVWVNAAGNYGSSNYYRQAVRLVGRNVAFGPSGNETLLEASSCLSLGGLRWANDWYLPPSSRTDYDVYVWSAPQGDLTRGVLLGTSERRQNLGASPIEEVVGEFCPRTAVDSVYLQVVWRSGPTGGDTLEILDFGNGFVKYSQAPYSAALSIPTSKARSVISVGAVDPPTGTSIAYYSSQGPSNDGRIIPSLSAPSGFDNSIYGNFGGTSAATPVVSGGLALMKQAGLATYNDTLADLARNSVVDLGARGPDNVFGTGVFRLPVPPNGGFPSTASQFVSLSAPTRLLDTRPTSAVGPANLIGKLSYGEVRKLPVRGQAGIPASATALAINLTNVTPDVPSYVQAYPTGYGALGEYSNLNNDRGNQIRSNFAIIPIGKDGTISIYAAFGGDIVVDSLGYFTPAPAAVAGGRFQALDTAQRVLDTRDLHRPLRNNSVINVPNPSGVAAADISALVITLTGAAPTQPAVVQAYPRGNPEAKGKTSTLNLDPLLDTANLAIVPTNGGGIALSASVMNNGQVDAIVDVIGYITSDQVAPGTSGRFVPVVPGRALDTRRNGGPLTDATVRTVRASDAPKVKVPDSATGVVWNTTVTETQRPGFATVWAWNTTRPTTSNLNWGPGSQTRAAAAISKVTNGTANVAFTANTPTPVPNAQLIVDVFGYFT